MNIIFPLSVVDGIMEGFVFMYEFMHVRKNVCIYMYMYVGVLACMYVCTSGECFYQCQNGNKIVDLL